jgi:DNA-binding response OmpR family regulator
MPEQDQPSQSSLLGHAILIVQRRWHIAESLVAAFKALGARTFAIRDASAAQPLVDAPDLSAAVLDGESGALCARLAQRNIPFVLYTGREEVSVECATAPLIQKPTSANEVVAKVKELLR